MGFRGDPGEVLRVPTAGTIKAGQLLVVGLGARDALTLERVRRAAGVAARNFGNAASVSVALPAHDADHVAAVAEGSSRVATPSSATSRGSDEAEVADVSLLSDAARRQDAIAAFEAAPGGGGPGEPGPRLGEHPPNDLTPELFADAVVALGKELSRPRQAEGRDRGPRRRGARGARLRRASWASARGRPTRRGWSS